jgi:hypothetical protein
MVLANPTLSSCSISSNSCCNLHSRALKPPIPASPCETIHALPSPIEGAVFAPEICLRHAAGARALHTASTATHLRGRQQTRHVQHHIDDDEGSHVRSVHAYQRHLAGARALLTASTATCQQSRPQTRQRLFESCVGAFVSVMNYRLPQHTGALRTNPFACSAELIDIKRAKERHKTSSAISNDLNSSGVGPSTAAALCPARIQRHKTAYNMAHTPYSIQHSIQHGTVCQLYNMAYNMAMAHTPYSIQHSIQHGHGQSIDPWILLLVLGALPTSNSTKQHKRCAMAST